MTSVKTYLNILSLYKEEDIKRKNKDPTFNEAIYTAAEVALRTIKKPNIASFSEKSIKEETQEIKSISITSSRLIIEMSNNELLEFSEKDARKIFEALKGSFIAPMWKDNVKYSN